MNEYRIIELRDASGALVCDEPIHQPETGELFVYATFGGRLFRLNAADAEPPRAVITDGLTVWQPGLPPSPDFVLACVEDDRGRRTVIRASYARRFELVSNPESTDEQCDYHEDEDEYYCPEGWYESNEFEEINWHVEGTVVGWMPLPAPMQKIEGVAVERIVAAVGGSDA